MQSQILEGLFFLFMILKRIKRKKNFVHHCDKRSDTLQKVTPLYFFLIFPFIRSFLLYEFTKLHSRCQEQKQGSDTKFRVFHDSDNRNFIFRGIFHTLQILHQRIFVDIVDCFVHSRNLQNE